MGEVIEMEQQLEKNGGKTVGIYLCRCRGEISNNIDLNCVSEQISQLPSVGYVEIHEALCSVEGRSWLKDDIREHSARKILIGACSPDSQNCMFSQELEEAGLNKYLSEQIDLREFCAWVHPEKDEATNKSIALINGGVRKILTLEPADDLVFSIEPATLVIGGGLSGMWAALQIARAGFSVYLVAKKRALRGDAENTEMKLRTDGHKNCKAEIPTPDDICKEKEIEVFLSSEVEEIDGVFGNRKVKLSTPEGFKELIVGTIVLAMDKESLEEGKKVADMLHILIDDEPTISADQKSYIMNGRGITVLQWIKDEGDIASSIEEGKSAIAELTRIMHDGTARLPRIIAGIDEFRCRGCGRCKEVCEYGAITLVKIEKDEQIAKVDELRCEGCGCCTFACCNGAIALSVYGANQLMANMIGIVEVARP